MIHMCGCRLYVVYILHGTRSSTPCLGPTDRISTSLTSLSMTWYDGEDRDISERRLSHVVVGPRFDQGPFSKDKKLVLVYEIFRMYFILNIT